jgi:hypothetical protein
MRRSLALAFAASIAAPLSALAADHTVFFAHGSARLTAEARAIIDQAAADYAATGETSVSLVGHTDTSGSAEYNMGLSERRARAVADALVASGVPASSMTAAWRGETEPAVATGDGVREPLNRRVEITISAPDTAAAPATVEDVLMGLRIGIGPYVGFNMEEDDESVFLGANLTVTYSLTENISLSAEQAVFYTVDADDNGIGGRSAIGAEYAFGDASGAQPFVGVNGGYMYIDGTATGGWFGGPELGVRFGAWEAKAAYDFVEDRDAEDGVISLTVGYNFAF